MAVTSAGVESHDTSKWHILVVLCILPVVQMLMSLYMYSCLPLYMVEQNLDLLNLGLCSGLALFTRTLLPVIAVKFVALEKLMVPTLALALTTGILSCIYPASATLLYLNTYCVMLLPSRSVLQAAGVKVWCSHPVKALRLYEVFYTLGYCMSSLWGATIYTLGGWQLCLLCQIVVLATSLVLALTVSVLRPVQGDFSRASTEKMPKSLPQTPDTDVNKSPTSTNQEDKVDSHEHRAEERQWWYLAFFICVGSALAIFAYASEWSIYLVYLTDRFDAGVLTIGIGQMSGDVGGASILMLSMVTGKRLACTTANKRACRCRIFVLPWSMVWLGALYALTYIMFLSHMMVVAIAGQVLMGTMYVLLQQGCSELVEWCSRNSDEAAARAAASTQNTYQKYAALADSVFCAGCCVGSILPYLVMKHLSVEWVCYISAGLIAAYTIAFTSVFLCVAPTKKSGYVPSEPAVDDSTCSI